MKQYLAGNIIDNILDVFEKKSSRKNAAKKLASWLSYFQLNSKSGFENKEVEYHPTIAVILNLLQRGLPTKLNKYAFEKIVNKSTFLDFKEKEESSIILKLDDLEDDIKDIIFRALHIVDPRIAPENLKESYRHSWENLGSDYEEDFLFSSLPFSIGNNGGYISQLISNQRTISSITKDSLNLSTLQNKVRNNFEGQRTDFSIEFPYYSSNKPKGIVIEIDGAQHQAAEQIFLDTERDRAVASSGWNNTLRIKTLEFSSSEFSNKINNILLPAINNDYIKICADNYNNPIWETTVGKEVMQVTLIPFGISRIQRAILEAITHNALPIDNEIWKIAVLERDVPCAQIAIDDLQKLIEELNNLALEQLIIPEIEIHIYSTDEFIDSDFQIKNAKLIDSFKSDEYYDLVIDIAILDRNTNSTHIAANCSEIINIRSVHYLDTKRIIATTELIKYKPFCAISNEDGLWVVEDLAMKNSLDYLLQSIFRKKEFRPGQLPIMHNALQCKSVIGLLPTGGGKSLTYQLSALLQPGICLVIDPIRSLMKDQVDGLYRNNIDSCVYINSTLQGEEKRKAMRKLADGEVQFVFVSPERLQMEEFRNMLDDMFNQGLYFSYCVIDEAHCVSEWGHDFRTAYLRLGENAINFCKTKNLEHLPLFGLTATASYDVLADVQRELSGNDEARRLTEDAVVRSEYTKRNELQYVIEEVTFPTGALNNIWALKRELSSKKQERIRRLLNDIPQTINEFLSEPTLVFSQNDWELNEKGEKEAFEKMQLEEYIPDNFYYDNNAALVFCPHTKGSFGVTDKFKIDKAGMPVVREGYYDILSAQNGINAGYFMGSGNDSDITGKVIQEESFDNQDKFINSELNMMVATKAFGMGIDKENIRYTVHVNYPGSIESYVQEAGRAGRDRKIALSYILFNDQEVSLPNEEELVDHDLDINMYFHKNSFKGVAKELAVLDELLTEIFFPDRTFELDNLINNEFDTNVKCNYWEGGANKRLYVNFNFSEPLGYLDLNSLNSFQGGSINPELSNNIFPLLKEYIENLNLTESVHLWIQRSDKIAGIEEILKSKRTGDSFEITVGFYNNAKERVKTITKWLHDVVHNSFNEQIVQRMRANCTDAAAFIEEVCDNYSNFTHGNALDFEDFCNKRDAQRNATIGTAYTKFMALYNGYRDKMDTEKAIYRLSTLGIIDDYTVNFSSNTFSLKGTKKTEKDYKDNLKGYLLKYYSEKTTSIRLKTLSKIDEPTPIRKSLNFLVNFVYKEIQKKRQLAMQDMKTACRLGLEKGSVELKDYIDLYFNSKYARAGYSYTNEKGKEINASLPDLTDNGKNDDLKWVWLFSEIVEDDPKAGQIDNIKHLRGACTRMLNNQPDSYTLLLLNAFALYMLEYKNPRYLLEAENMIINAFSNIQEKEPDWDDNKLEEIYNKFVSIVIDKNTELEANMEKNDFSFDFDSVMIKRLLNPLQKANSLLQSLNEILN
jgi:ATP-dependent DNA helicase RecQ